MTKVTVIGEQKLKPIELVKYLPIDANAFENSSSKPASYQNVELISRNYNDEGLDLIFCYNVDRNNKNTATLHLGRWNDGVV